MIIYVQWAKTVPEDYFVVDLDRQSVLNRVQKKTTPTGNEVLDNNPGWINSVICQGILFEGFDHYAFEVINAGNVIITVWNDDPVDYGTTRFALIYNFLDPAPDPTINNEINTRQTVTAYGTSDVDFPNILPWEQFVIPPASRTWHGVWMEQSLYDAHTQNRTLHGWREWIK